MNIFTFGVDARFWLTRPVVHLLNIASPLIFSDNDLSVPDTLLAAQRSRYTKLSLNRRRKEADRLLFNLYRSHDRGLPSTLTIDQWFTLLLIYGHRCAFCGRPLGSKMLSMEHLLPLSRGGGTTFTNIVPACKTCNNVRGELC